MKLKSVAKYYEQESKVKVIEKKKVVFYGRLKRVPKELLIKDVKDINPIINSVNDVVIEFILKGD